MSVDHSKNIVEIRDISFHYGTRPVLEDISFDIHRGDYLGIIGPNGGGKTTLLKIVLGLLKPDKGSVRLFGTDIAKFRDWKKIGYVPQKAIHFDEQFPATVAEIVGMGRSAARGLGRRLNREDSQKIKQALVAVDMQEFSERRIGELSAGQQQRVFIARALASEPEIIFLDEPTVGVDVSTQEQFYLLLKKLNQSMGLTLVLVSHDIDIVASQATEVACVNCRLVCHCPPKELNASDYIKQLYGKEIKLIAHHDH